MIVLRNALFLITIFLGAVFAHQANTTTSSAMRFDMEGAAETPTRADQILERFDRGALFWDIPYDLTNVLRVVEADTELRNDLRAIRMPTLRRAAEDLVNANKALSLIHEDIGIGYAALWPMSLRNLLKQADEILPQWHYIKLHWEPSGNQSLTDSVPYERWWHSTRRQIEKLNTKNQAFLHKTWHNWSSRMLPVLRVDGDRLMNSKAIILSEAGIRRIKSDDSSALRAFQKLRLPPKGLLATPMLLGPREIGGLGLKGEQVSQWLLETREIVLTRGIPLPKSLRFQRRPNVNGTTTLAEVNLWLDYERRRYRQKTPSHLTIPFCDRPA